MKSLALLKIIFSLGCVYGTFPIMSSLAGSVPVGASSGVRLPSSSGTSVIPPRPPVTAPPAPAVTAPPAPAVTAPPAPAVTAPPAPAVTAPPAPAVTAPPAPAVTAPPAPGVTAPPAPAVTAPPSTPSVTAPPAPAVTAPSEPMRTPVARPPRSTNRFLVVTPTTQATLNQSATETFTELRVTDPTISSVIVSSNSLSLTSPVSGITITSNEINISPSTANDPSITPLQAGVTTAMEVASGNGVDITSNSFTVNIPPVSLVPDSKQVSTTVTITTANKKNLDLVLTGTSEQVSNAAGFVAMGASAEFSSDQIKTGTSIALTGANFSQVATLIDSITGLMVVASNSSFSPKLNQESVFAGNFTDKNLKFEPVAQSVESNLSSNPITVNPERLNTAILAFNQIIDDSDDVTIAMLSRNSEFLTIGKVLQRLRIVLVPFERAS